MNSGRISIISRLGTVHMVIGRAILVFSAPVPHQFQCTVGNHLIGIHIRSRSGTTLNHIDRKLFMMLTFKNFLTSFQYGVCLFFCQQVQFTIGNGSSHLCNSQSLNKQRVFVQVKFANAKIFNTTECLHSVQCTFRHLTTTYQVAFCTSFC